MIIYSMVLREADEDLIEAINADIESLEEDGVLDELKEELVENLSTAFNIFVRQCHYTI